MARPKKPIRKKPVNLTIDPEALKKGKRIAAKENKSLSQFTEDTYINIHDDFFKVISNPKAMIKEIKEKLDAYEKTIDEIKKQEEQSKK